MINLIPIGYLNEACFLSLNTNDKKYQMCLKIAQDTLKDIIGGDFYEQIETEYDADTLSSDNDVFYDPYIKDYLSWLTYLEYLRFSNADATPTGIRQFRDDNSNVLPNLELAAFEKNVREKMMFYKGKMLNFLREAIANDSSKYPLYKEKCSDAFGFAITSIDKKSDVLIKVNKAIITNE